MKRYPIGLVAATLLIGVLLSGNAYSQRPLLGAAEPQEAVKTPLGITTYTNGFNRYRKNETKKGIKQLTNTDHETLVGEFVDIATTAPALLDQIDAAWRARIKAWTDCGYWRAWTLNPKVLTVTIEPGPFTDLAFPGYLLAGIVRGNQIRIVVAHANSSNDGLQHYRNLAAWEFGNFIQCQILGCAKTIDGEIGHGAPCR